MTKNLYLCVRGVTDDTPMINGGNDVRTLFKTGDAIEFELRTRPNNDDKQVIEGDLRLLVSVFEKKPVAVLYRYKVPGHEASGRVHLSGRHHADRSGGSARPTPRSPSTALRRATACGRPSRWRRCTSLRQRARPIAATSAIVYSDKTGAIDELRMYWANPVNGMVNDLSTEARIMPATWGRFTIEE